VEPLTIIKDFDIVEDGQSGLSQVLEAMVMDEFGFESAPERFHGGVIVAMAGGTHAGGDLRDGQ